MTSASENIATSPSITPITDIAADFITTVRKSNTEDAGTAFKNAVDQITQERGWEADSAARRLISCVVSESKRDMTDPVSFLQKPLKEIDVGVNRTGSEGDKVANSMSDIQKAIAQQNSKIAEAVSNGLSKLDFEA